MTAPTDPGSAPRSARGGEIQGARGVPRSKTPAPAGKLLEGASLLALFFRIPQPRLAHTAAVVLSLLTLSLLIAGCAHTSRTELEAGGAFAPLPPVFLTGPAGVLLTNVEGFSAHVVMKSDSLDPQQNGTSGELLCRGAKLLFAPDPGKQNKKYSRGGFSFIWDVATGHGTVLSEALQAYAPVSVNASSTNLITHPAGAASEAAGGHAGEVEEDIVELTDGSRAVFRVVRAADLKRFPVHLSSVSNMPPFTLSFSKIRLVSPPTDLFVPPNGFTKYESAEAMMTELVMRQHNLRRGRSGGSSGTSEPVYDYRQRR